MDNDADSNFVLGDFAKLINNGSFTNAGFFNPSSQSGGIINNSGSIINDRNLVNTDRMNNLCGGTVTGPVNGKQPVTVCSID